jgi:hypothetical protein
MKDMKVTFSDTTRDYSTWLHEKNSSVLRSLCALLRDIPSVKENARKEAKNLRYIGCFSLKFP